METMVTLAPCVLQPTSHTCLCEQSFSFLLPWASLRYNEILQRGTYILMRPKLSTRDPQTFWGPGSRVWISRLWGHPCQALPSVHTIPSTLPPLWTPIILSIINYNNWFSSPKNLEYIYKSLSGIFLPWTYLTQYHLDHKSRSNGLLHLETVTIWKMLNVSWPKL